MAVITTENLSDGFDEAAGHYDLMVTLNPGYHRHLRAAADALVEKLPAKDPTIIDLGCGSGASTRALQRSLEAAGRPVQITGIDASAGMLAQAREKVWPTGVQFAVGMAEDVLSSRSIWGLEEPRSGLFAAYLFRNVGDRDEVLKEVYDLLDDDGTLVVQEYSVIGSRRAAVIWTLICWLVVIPLSWILVRQTRLYRYLWRSVLDFDAVPTFTDRLATAGFVDVEVRTVPGWQRGILHTFRARKPRSDGT